MEERRVEDRRLETRVSILETKVAAQGTRDSETIDAVHDLSNKLIFHIQEEGLRDAKIAAKVDNIENTVKESSDNIKTLTAMATDSKEDLIEWRAVLKTATRAIAVGVFIISSLWGVWQYLDYHGVKLRVDTSQLTDP